MLRAMLQRKRERKAPASQSASTEAAQADEASEEEEAASDSEEHSDGSEGPLEGEGSSEQEDDDLEPWHEWLQRVTRLALQEMKKAQVDDWVDAARDRQFQLAGHISRRDDKRWSTIVLNWTPQGRRARRHPLKRWEDDINKGLKELGLIQQDGAWRIYAEDRSTWKDWEAQTRQLWIEARQRRREEKEQKEAEEKLPCGGGRKKGEAPPAARRKQKEAAAARIEERCLPGQQAL